MSCVSLKDLSVSPDNPYFSVIDGSLVNLADRRLVCCFYAGRQSVYKEHETEARGNGAQLPELEYTVPEGIVEIGGEALAWQTELTAVVLPDSVIRIGNNAFESCSHLRDIQIPESVTDIGDEAFDACLDLERVYIPAGVKHMGEDVFCGWDFIGCLTLIVEPDSFAEGYSRDNGIPYEYPG